MEAQHRNAPLVHGVGIDLAVAALVGHLLAPPAEAHRGAVVAAVVVLELLAVAAAWREPLDPSQHAVARQAAPTPDLDVIAAGEVELLVVHPPRHVEMRAAH